LDEIIMFKPLTKDNIDRIISLQMKDLNRRLADKELECELSESAIKYISDRGYDPQFGARPLKRFLEKSVETLVARVILEGNVSPKSVLKVNYDADSDKLIVEI